MKTYETWQVMRLLSRHRDWRAEAPETAKFHMEQAVNDGFYGAVFEMNRGYGDGWEPCSPSERSDWRIIKPKKRSSKVVVRVSGSTGVLRFESGPVGKWTALDPSKTYKLVEVAE